jgi:hypothetical protein
MTARSVPPWRDQGSLVEGFDGIRALARHKAILTQVGETAAESLTLAERTMFHRSISFRHPQAADLEDLIVDVMEDNAASSTGVRAVAVHAPSGSGKSRLCEDSTLSLLTQEILTSNPIHHPGGVVSEPQPLVWVSTVSSGVRAFAGAVCKALGLHPAESMDAASRIALAADEMGRARTRIVIFDDLHALSRGMREDIAANLLRMAINLFPTIVFTTIDLYGGTPALNPSGPGRDQVVQVLRRIAPLEVRRLGSTRQDLETWSDCFYQALDTLKLLDRTPDDDAAAISAWLFTSTGGRVAEMYQTIAKAAVRAVGTSERLHLADVQATHEDTLKSLKTAGIRSPASGEMK